VLRQPDVTQRRLTGGMQVMATAAEGATGGMTGGSERSRSVAVIGAGAAGLVTARSMKDEGHDVTVFEMGSSVGGVWVYDNEIESTIDGTTKSEVHSSMYSNLRTNLPREVMGYRDFFFGDVYGEDERRFCSHAEVQAYLRSFSEAFNISEMIKFDTKVLQVRRQPAETETGGMRWEVSTATSSPASSDSAAQLYSTQVFDAVVVCNGHYSQPRLPSVKGADVYPGLIMHSHSYRTPERFKGQRVVIVGAQASGEDIARDVADVAAEVYICARSWQNADWARETSAIGPKGNIWRRNMVIEALPDGRVVFEGGVTTDHGVDAIVYCTGYIYDFPFLDTTSSDAVVTVKDNHVSPLYQHMFNPQVGPSLSFIGLPWKIVPFPLFQLQSQWIAQLLSGRAAVPSQSEMQVSIDELERSLAPIGPIPRRHAHMLGDDQFEYNNMLADRCNLPRLPEWRRKLYKYTGTNKRSRPEEYRDKFEDDDIIHEAVNEQKKPLLDQDIDGQQQKSVVASRL